MTGQIKTLPLLWFSFANHPNESRLKLCMVPLAAITAVLVKVEANAVGAVIDHAIDVTCEQ